MPRGFKSTHIGGNDYLYPVPVIKNQKYLILCPDEDQGMELIKSIEKGLIEHPDSSFKDFHEVGIHTDDRTRIIQYIKN